MKLDFSEKFERAMRYEGYNWLKVGDMADVSTNAVRSRIKGNSIKRVEEILDLIGYEIKLVKKGEGN